MIRSLPVLPSGLVKVEGNREPAAGVMAIAGGAAAFYAAPRPGEVSRSQDAAALIPLGDDRGVIAVADGMGGMPGGRDAALLAIETLIEDLSQGPVDPSNLRVRIIDAMERANDRILATGVGSATTLALAEIDSGAVRAYHVGDSEILAFGQRGRVKLQSVPHSPVGFAYHAGMLDQAEAIAHEDRHLVSNVLGSRDMRIEVGSPVPLELHDTVVVCSDGLADNLQFDEISAILRTGRLDLSLRRLVSLARERMTTPGPAEPSKPDDLSVVAYRRRPGAALTRRLS